MTTPPHTAEASRRCRRIHENILAQTDRLVELSQEPEDELALEAAEVSGWSVAEHLDHLAKSNRAIVERIQRAIGAGAAGDEGDGDGASMAERMVGRLVLLTGFIPRGVGETPEFMRPGSTSPDEVREMLRRTHAGVVGLRPRLGQVDRATVRFNHPVFGALTPRQWLRFMEVHTHHHLKIIRDIRRARDR